jgi:hypothetical protein
MTSPINTQFDLLDTFLTWWSNRLQHLKNVQLKSGMIHAMSPWIFDVQGRPHICLLLMCFVFCFFFWFVSQSSIHPSIHQKNPNPIQKISR